MILKNVCNSPFYFRGSMSVSILQLSSIQSHTLPGNSFAERWNRCTPKMTFIFSMFTKFSFLHICSTLHIVLSWSAPLLSYPTIKISSAMPNTFGSSLNILSIFSGIGHMPGLPQMVAAYIYTCQTDMRIWLSMIIFQLVSNCGIQS